MKVIDGLRDEIDSVKNNQITLTDNITKVIEFMKRIDMQEELVPI
jgi:hypothetical protein